MKRSVLFAGVVAMSLALALAWVLPASSASSSGEVRTASVPDLLVEYPVPGNPESVAVEAPNRVWFTLPAQNLVGRLVVTSSVDYAVVTHTVPTPNSYPYDIAYANGAVWFTERDGDKIGRLDTTTGTVLEYPVLTLDSEPSGIDVLPGTPTRVWFTERAADKLGQLVVTDTTTTAMHEYAIPVQYSGAEPQDVDIRDSSTAWFTAPGVGCIGRISSGVYLHFRCISGGRPWSIKVPSSGLPVWFTDPVGNRVGAYIPTTTTIFRYFPFPDGGSDPHDLVLMDNSVWCTENAGQSVAQVDLSTRAVREFSVSGGALGGIGADANGHIWFAERDAMRIGEWRPPYFHKVCLPLVVRS